MNALVERMVTCFGAFFPPIANLYMNGEEIILNPFLTVWTWPTGIFRVRRLFAYTHIYSISVCFFVSFSHRFFSAVHISVMCLYQRVLCSAPLFLGALEWKMVNEWRDQNAASAQLRAQGEKKYFTRSMCSRVVAALFYCLFSCRSILLTLFLVHFRSNHSRSSSSDSFNICLCLFRQQIGCWYLFPSATNSPVLHLQKILPFEFRVKTHIAFMMNFWKEAELWASFIASHCERVFLDVCDCCF